MGHLIRICIAGITRYFPCVTSYKGNSNTLLFILSDNLTGARKLGSTATYFQLGKPVTGKLNETVTNCVVSLEANKGKLTTATTVALELQLG